MLQFIMHCNCTPQKPLTLFLAETGKKKEVKLYSFAKPCKPLGEKCHKPANLCFKVLFIILITGT